MTATYNRLALPPTGAYALLVRQYPDLTLYASEGARYYARMAAVDQAGLDLLARAANVLWQAVDRFFAAVVAALPADALVGLAALKRAWAGLWIAAVSRIARPATALGTVAISGGGAALLAAAERDLRTATALSGRDWLARGTALLLALYEPPGASA